MPRALALLLLLPVALAGCLEPGPVSAQAQAAADDPTLLAQAEPLWWNPQTAPHPAFGWATLSNPAEGLDVPAHWRPIPAREMPTPVTGLDPVRNLRAQVGTGAGIALFGSLAVVPGYSSSTKIVDISNPTNPQVLSTIPTRTRGAADLIAYPDGRLVTVLATGSGTLPVYDITDPTRPTELPWLEPSRGTHKVSVVPGTPIVYNANSDGGGLYAADPSMANGVTEIFDLSDPENPVHVQDFPNGYGCHHIYFWIHPTEDKQRALCAGIEMTQIWDIADPRHPEVLVSIPVHHGMQDLPPVSAAPAMFSHFSILNDDGSVLIVGDETGGGLAAACDAHVEAAGKSASGPLGNLWFYDVSDETNPRLLGSFSPSAHFLTNLGSFTAGCTAHHGRLVPDPEGRDLLVMAFYGAGVLLIDFTDPANPRLMDQWSNGTNTWEAWYYNGYVFTGDLRRGMDVLTFA